MSQEKKERIFISYKRVDKERVFAIKDGIKKATDEDCWIDLYGIESDEQFSNVIVKAINRCEVFLFMYSKEHAKITDFEEDWTIKEITFAKEKKKRIVIVNIDDTPLIDQFLFEFPRKQRIDASDASALARLYKDLCSWLKIDTTKLNQNQISDGGQLKDDSSVAVKEDNHDAKIERLVSVWENSSFHEFLVDELRYCKDWKNIGVRVCGIVIHKENFTTSYIPSNVMYYGVSFPVTSIGEDTFSDCTSLTSINIPDSVTSIGERAFKNCVSLSSLFIPDSVKYIGKNVFFGCTSLTSIYISNGITKIEDFAFCGCSSLTSIVIPDSITNIGDHTFSFCSSLTSLKIPNSVMSIGRFAFCGTSLISIIIPNSVACIEMYAFEYCSSLTSIKIPNSVTAIGDGAFSNCSSLSLVTISNGVLSIGSETFSGCTSLKSIVIPESVAAIGEKAFYYCTSLTSISISNNVTCIGKQAFSNCSALVSIVIPNSITNINESAFQSCVQLLSVTIPNSVTTIESWAFYDCGSLTSVTIPNSVTEIGSYTFASCPSLNTIRYDGTKQQWISIIKGEDWNEDVPAKVVYCTDGDVEI